MRFRVLMVEDDTRFCRAVREHFAQNDAEVVCCVGEKEARQLFNAQRFDLVLLDVMMRRRDEGYDICRWIRERSKTLPIIFVTARGDEMDEERGLQYGCDYVVKPYSVRLLFHRASAMVERLRAMQQKGSAISMHGVGIDGARSGYMTLDGREIHVTPKQFKLLHVLMQNAGQVLSREQLLTEVWDYGYIEDERVVDKHIYKLKKLLGDKAWTVQSVYEFGYVGGRGCFRRDGLSDSRKAFGYRQGRFRLAAGF